MGRQVTLPRDLSNDAYGVPPTHPRGQTDAWENITFLQLRLQAVVKKVVGALENLY